jgi:hypothetical protein
VPKGASLGSGTLDLVLDEDVFTLSRTAETGGFGASRWSRVKALNLTMNLDTLVIRATTDPVGEDEPFLWTVFVKLDGDTIEANDITNSTATVISISGSHKNLNVDGADQGAQIAIPPNVGQFTTVLKTARGIDPKRGLAAFGFLVVALEQDETTDGAIEEGRTALVGEVQQGLNEAIRAVMTQILNDPHEFEQFAAQLISRAEQATVDAIVHRDNIFNLLFSDDFVGSAFHLFKFSDLLSGDIVIPLDLDFRNDGHYQATGSLSIS